jgi:hypothetical protein
VPFVTRVFYRSNRCMISMIVLSVCPRRGVVLGDLLVAFYDLLPIRCLPWVSML